MQKFQHDKFWLWNLFLHFCRSDVEVSFGVFSWAHKSMLAVTSSSILGCYLKSLPGQLGLPTALGCLGWISPFLHKRKDDCSPLTTPAASLHQISWPALETAACYNSTCFRLDLKCPTCVWNHDLSSFQTSLQSHVLCIPVKLKWVEPTALRKKPVG